MTTWSKDSSISKPRERNIDIYECIRCVYIYICVCVCVSYLSPSPSPKVDLYVSRYYYTYRTYGRKFRSQRSNNIDKWNRIGGKSQRRERKKKRRSEKRKCQKKEDAAARKGRKIAKHCVFQMFCGSGKSKSRLAKVAGAEPSGEMRDEKLHAVLARNTFRSQKC